MTNGEKIAADLVVIGVGARAETALAEEAGLAIDHGVLVNEYLETSRPHVFAAGDIARWPDPLTGETIRVEHFVVAERQGETAARNILGRHERFAAIPFFWTEQYDLGIAYVGHGAGWDAIEVDGDLQERICSIIFRRGGRKVAAAFVHRDLEGLCTELDFERSIVRREGRPDPGGSALLPMGD